MRRRRAVEDLTVDELRWLLIEKRRAARQGRVERFRRNGRAVLLGAEALNPSLESWETGTIGQEDEDALQRPSVLRRILDGLLLLVEVSAVVGLILILVNGVNVYQRLNQEAAAVMIQPTLTPTPLVVAVVLPSGHTPPDSPGGAQFNDAEIPEHLRPLVQSLSNIPVPTPGPQQAVRVQLPAIRVDAPIVQGDGWEQLKKGVGQHLGTGNPGERNNLVLSAHNDIFGEIFRDLDRLQPGDEVIVYTSQRAYTYIVTDTQIVEPTHVEVMAPTSQPTITLISCYPYRKNTHRIVVTARLSTR